MSNAENVNAPRINSAASERSVSLIDIIYIIRSRWKSGVLSGLILSSLFVYAMASSTKMYKAEGSVTVELQTENVMDVRKVVNDGVTHANLLDVFMNTHIERLRARSLCEAVVATFSTEELQAFLAPYVEQSKQSGHRLSDLDPVSLLLKYALTVDRGEGDASQLIRVVIEHSSPVLAQKIANAYLDQYIANIASTRSIMNNVATDFLSQQVDVMGKELAEAETDLHAFRSSKNLFTVQPDEGFVVERLRRLSDAETDANIRLLEVDSRIAQIEAAGGELERLMEIPFIGQRVEINSIYNQLNELKRERQSLDTVYLLRHPQIVDNMASQESVLAALTRAVEHACKQVKNESHAIRAELKILRQKTSQAQQMVLDAERELLEYQRLERNVQNLREMYNLLATRYNETNISRKLNFNNVHILNRAQLPRTPEALTGVQVAAAAFFLWGAFLVGVPLGVELLDNRLTSFSDIEFYSGKPLLGGLRFFSGKNLQQLSQAVLRDDRDLAEPFRSIYSALRLKKRSGKNLSLVVTSSLPCEGKSVVSSNLASVIALHGYRVLLVDCDLRRSTLQAAFEQDNKYGLIKWYQAARSLKQPNQDQSLSRLLGIVTVNDKFSLLPAGGTSTRATELLSDDRVAALFQRLKTEYDVVIFDTAPVGLFSDATLVAEYADECVFVARQFKATRSKVRNSIALMEDSNAPVLGVVFNGIKDVPAAIGYGNQSRNSYGHGYERNMSKYQGYYGQDS
jgi:succinoglycan biosynthesis transport protein ExoP